MTSKILRMTMTLERIRPEIWRRVEVPDDLSLTALHQVILASMPWYGGHLWQFEHDGVRYGLPLEDDWSESPKDARTTTLRDVLGADGERLEYVYDFGDWWELTLEVDERFEPEESATDPELLDGERAAPPEDCGGVPGYERLVEETESGGASPDHREWLGDWAPDAFEADDLELPSVETLERKAHSDARMMGARPVDEEGSSTRRGPERPVDSPFAAPDASEEVGTDLDIEDVVEQAESMLSEEFGDLADLPLDEDLVKGQLETLARDMLEGALPEEVDTIERIEPPPGEKLKTFPTSMALRDCLGRLPVEQLDTIFDRHGFETYPSRREERADRIAAELEDDSYVVGLLEDRFDDRARRILDSLLVEPHEDVPARPLVDKGIVGAEDDWLRFQSNTALGRLRRHGLVHVGLHSIGGRDRVYIGIPEELTDAVETWLGEGECGTLETRDEVVDHLLETPPRSVADWNDRLGALSEADIRSALIERIAEARLDEDDIPGAVEIFGVIGVGDRSEDLERIIADPTPDSNEQRRLARLAAYSIWTLEAPEDPHEQADVLDLPLEDIRELVEASFGLILGTNEEAPEIARVPADQLLEADPEEREALFDETERLRRESGADAGLFYGPLLADPTYRELWPLFVDVVAQEGHPEDAWLLEGCAGQLEGDEARACRKAAMTLRSSGVGSDAGEVDGYGLLGSCDGESAFPICACLEIDNGVFTFLNAIVRTDTHDLRDGFAVPEVPESELKALVGSVESSGTTEFVRVPLEVAAGIVERSMHALRERGESPPVDLVDPLIRFQRLSGRAPESLELEPPDDVSREDVRAVFSHSLFQSWVFGLAELYDADLLPLPPPQEADETWYAEAARALGEQPRVRQRLASMCRHMALWSHHRESANTAGFFSYLADSVLESFESSPLVAEMLEKTPWFYDARPSFGELAPYFRPSDPATRHDFADRFLDGDDDRDCEPERRLDLIELAFEIFEFVRPVVPSHRQPRWEAMIELAGRLGTTLAEAEADATELGGSRLRTLVDEVLQTADWTETRPELIRREVVSNVAAELGIELD